MKKTLLGIATVAAVATLSLGSIAVAFADSSPSASPSSATTVSDLSLLHHLISLSVLGNPRPGSIDQSQATTPVVMATVPDPQTISGSMVSWSALGNPQPAPPTAHSTSASSSQVQPEARGSVGPFNPPPVSSGYAYELTTVTTIQGGISVGGNFAGGGYIICVNTSNGNEYDGGVQSGVTSALNDYIAAPSGTYNVYIANPTNTTQTYSNLTVYYN